MSIKRDIWEVLKEEIICPKNKWNRLARTIAILGWTYLILNIVISKLPEIIKFNSHLAIEMF